MRLAGLALFAAAALSAGTSLAQQCVHPPEQAAFHAEGLKSQLMITALTCDVREKYNAFILRFRPDLTRHERTLLGYFNRSFGGRGQQRHDDYITSLANMQSQAGLRDGTLFCQRNAGLFDEVLALPKGADLAVYAAAKRLVQPIELNSCAGSGMQTASKGGSRRD